MLCCTTASPAPGSFSCSEALTATRGPSRITFIDGSLSALSAGWRRTTFVRPWRTPGSDRQPWRSRLASERCAPLLVVCCFSVSQGSAVGVCCCACTQAPGSGLPVSLHIAGCAECRWHPRYRWLAAAVKVYQLPQLICQTCCPLQGCTALHSLRSSHSAAYGAGESGCSAA